MGKIITDDVKKLAVHMYEKTNTAPMMIATVLNISETTLYKILDEYDVPRRSDKAVDLKLAVDMYKKGFVVKEIYKKTNTNCASLYAELDRLQIPRRHSVKNRAHTDTTNQELEDSILELYKTGKSQTEIARELVISRHTVIRIVEKAKELGVIGVREVDIEKEKEKGYIKEIAKLYIEMSKDISIREVAKVLQVNEPRLYHEIRNQKRELMLKEES